MTKLKDSRIISHVSFLYQGQRTIVEANDKGTFKVPVTSVVEGRVRTSYKNLSASELIAHPSIIACDPVLTLKSGEKIRVFDGGDPSYLPAMSQGIIERHDKFEMMRRKFEKKKEVLKQKTRRTQKTTKKPAIVPPYVPSNKTIKKDPGDTDEYDNPFHWDDDDYGIF